MDPWSRGREVADGILRFRPQKLKKCVPGMILPSERDRDIVACPRHSSAQMCLCQTPGRLRPRITGRFAKTAVRDPALDAISIRAAVVCVPLLLCAGRRQHTSCAVRSLLLKTGNNTPYPCPASEAMATVRPTSVSYTHLTLPTTPYV